MFENPRYEELRDLARSLGLDFFDVIFEEVPQDIMSEIAAYGLPTRPRHWSWQDLQPPASTWQNGPIQNL